MAKYHVTMTGLSRVRASTTIFAVSPEEAEKVAKEKTGDVVWEYEGIEDDTVEAVAHDA